jgi:TRAP-type transport system periplasmic protein
MKRYLPMLIAIAMTVVLLIGCAAPAPTTAPAPSPTSAPTTAAPKPTATATAPASTATQGEVKPIKITFALQSPPDGWFSTHALQPWLKQMEDASKGKIKFDVYYGQTLVKMQDAWDAVATGVADSAFITHSTYPGLTPLSDMFVLTFVPYDTAKQFSTVMWKMYEKYPAIRNEFKAVKLLEIHNSFPNFPLNSKRPINTVADFNGLKMRVSAGPPVDMAKALGVAPIVVPTGDVYMNMQKGVIDGNIQNWDVVYSFKLFELAKYYSNIPMFGALFSTIMNQDKWNSLPKDVQDALTPLNGQYAAEFMGYNMQDTIVPFVRDAIKKQGFQMVENTPKQEDMDKMIALGGKPTWDKWVKDNTAKGYPAKEMLDTMLQMLKDTKP